MTNKIILALEAEQMTKEIPTFAPGDTIVVQVKVKEGDRSRLQAFEGVVIAKRNRGVNSAFTVRKISCGPSDASPVLQSLDGQSECVAVDLRVVLSESPSGKPDGAGGAEHAHHEVLHGDGPEVLAC